MSVALEQAIVDPQVLAFSQEKGLVDSLEEVARLSAAAFPHEPLHIVLQIDPEDREDRQICVQLDATGWTSDQMLVAHDDWFEQLSASTLSPAHRSVFRLHVVETA